MHGHHLRSRTPRGFTLMELLVVVTIFSITVLVASDTFLLSNRTQRKIYAFERTQSDARFTMEAITREIRTGLIDYSYYSGRAAAIGTPEPELALVSSDGTKVRFKVSDATTNTYCFNSAQSRPCLLVTVNNGTPQPITPRNVSVRTARFYLSPTTDPTIYNAATNSYANNVQPRVTVVLSLESTGGSAIEKTVVYLQTTAVSRQYKR